jgi:hypothetical protein
VKRLTLMDSMDKHFEKTISSLTNKEQETARWLKRNMLSVYNTLLKPLLLAVFMFYLFTKIKNVVGLQEAMFIQLTVIIIMLRVIASKLG